MVFSETDIQYALSPYVQNTTDASGRTMYHPALIARYVERHGSFASRIESSYLSQMAYGGTGRNMLNHKSRSKPREFA